MLNRLLFYTNLTLLFITCSVMSIIQWLNYMITSKIDRKWQLRINFLMQELIFSQFTVCLEWFCQTRIRLFVNKRKTFDSYGQKPALVISNHRYPNDFMFFLIFIKMFGPLGAAKSFVKYELRHVPIFGWSFLFSEHIFLKRDWQQDKKNISNSLKNLNNSIVPISVFFMPEGTRFTQRKHEIGIDYAKENQLPIFKHHLIPRAKGFNYILRYIRENYSNDDFNIYNMELIQAQDSADINWKNFFLCQKLSADFYLEQITANQLPEPDADDSKYTELLYEIFNKKDQIVEQHRTHSFIPNCEVIINHQRSILTLLRCIAMNIVIGGSIVYYLFYYITFILHNPIIRWIFLLISIIVIYALYMAFKSAKVSNYGEKKAKKMN
ncbi:hypothetical protein HUG17_7854 [Dermatophagoides farinae]|uniref:Phospholipid/glycerol acyltransferase domain-containing protein n=2 Tax=Dermatophagoides farinae TaxID=6954 RepID=A0A9D4SFR7_DERFA|nr:hypothetical protein HUG17_7854 [Dermatophagoides farinae]